MKDDAHIALYRRLMALAFPPPFRREYGAEMITTFRARLEACAARGGTARLWLRTLIDLAMHGTAEWFSAARALGPGSFQGVGSDVRQAMRGLAADRAFTVVAVLTLALGIGANTAVFSVVDAVLLRPLPYPSPERLVTVHRSERETGKLQTWSYPDAHDLLDRQRTLDGFAPYATRNTSVQAGDEDRRVATAIAPPALFHVLGVEAARGRVYEEAVPERALNLAVVSARLASALPDPTRPGATLRVDGVDYEVTGVMPDGFDFPNGTDLWVTLPADEYRNGHWLDAIGRLAPGVTRERATADVAAIVGALAAEYPGRYVDPTATLRPLRDAFTKTAQPVLYLLLGTVGIVLLITCANLAGLSLVRGTRRADDLRVRIALGASRSRVARLALVESALVCTLGAAVGFPLAVWAAKTLSRLAPAGMLPEGTVRPDLTVLAFTAASAIVAALASGVLPAIGAARAAGPGAGATRGRVSSDRRTNTLRGALVAMEVALAVVLLSGAGLLVRTLDALHDVPLGFDPGNVRVANLTVRDATGAEASEDDVRAFVEDARRALVATPGVRSAAAVAYPPFGDLGWGTRVRADGAPEVERPLRYLAHFNAVTPGYFDLLAIPLRAGRLLREGDDGSGEHVAVVSTTFARRVWGDQNPLGRRFSNGNPGDDTPWLTVVGVVGDVKNEGLTADAGGEVYQTFDQLAISDVTFLVDGAWSRPETAAAVRAAIRGARAGIAVPDLPGLADRVDATRGRTRFATLLLGVFAGLATLLASIGIYGLISYAVSQRSRELGLRRALGARPAELAGLAVRTGVRPAAVGTLVGVGLSLGAARWIEALLYGVPARDPFTLAAVAALALVVAGCAAAVPAARAMRVEPMSALRAE